MATKDTKDKGTFDENAKELEIIQNDFIDKLKKPGALKEITLDENVYYKRQILIEKLKKEKKKSLFKNKNRAIELSDLDSPEEELKNFEEYLESANKIKGEVKQLLTLIETLEKKATDSKERNVFENSKDNLKRLEKQLDYSGFDLMEKYRIEGEIRKIKNETEEFRKKQPLIFDYQNRKETMRDLLPENPIPKPAGKPKKNNPYDGLPVFGAEPPKKRKQ